jgi:hypothetical protein
VKYARANFLTPIPQAASYADLNATLAARCRARQGEHAGRHATTIGERLVAATAALRGLPAMALEPCEKRAAWLAPPCTQAPDRGPGCKPSRHGRSGLLLHRHNGLEFDRR